MNTLQQCPRCGLALENVTGHCPDCGFELGRATPARVESAGALVRDYFATLKRVLFNPASFFREMPVTGGVTGPLAFALVTHWIGAAIGFLWNLVIGGAIRDYMDSVYKIVGDLADVDDPGMSGMMMEARDRISNWIWGAGSVIVDPFLTLVSVLFTSLLVFIAARLLVSQREYGKGEVTYESAVRVVCYGMSPAIFAALPFFGPILSGFFTMIVTVIAAREVYRTGYARAIVVALFPKILFLGIMVLGLAFLLLTFLKLLTTAF